MKHLISRILKEQVVDAASGVDSYPVNDRRIIREFINNPQNPFLVSFPRTGSHWLRMLMERYFERPSLTRVFYFPERTDYLTLHTHDLDLDVSRENVIYLYRDPVETVYSQIRYHKQDVSDVRQVTHWSDLYGRHLAKWLCPDTQAIVRTPISYRELQSALVQEFAKICEHFHVELDSGRLTAIAGEVTRSHVKDKTGHDPQVVNANERYPDGRERFRMEQGDRVWDAVLDGREFVRSFFA